ncbi:MAG TPA: 3,4-dihydroxy-2-butanone-4-phosphate synthase [Acidimicrobiia bacterium]
MSGSRNGSGNGLDQPGAPGVPEVAEALRRLRQGEMVLVSDGCDREDEADLTMAAQWVSPEAIAFMLRHGRGLVCMPCDGARLDRLRVGPMITDGSAGCDTAFTVSIDHQAVGSGISAADRAATIRAVLDPWSGPEDFVRPGHVFPLRARPGGVLVRPGHTEAAVDLARLAGLAPCAVICEVLNDDGSIARGDELEALALRFDLARVSIAAIVAWRRSRATRLAAGVRTASPTTP